jgi:anthranilate synthase component I
VQRYSVDLKINEEAHMLKQTAYEQYEQLAKSSQRFVVFQEFSADQLTPVNCYLALQEKTSRPVLLESLAHNSHHGRYSHVCFNAIACFESKKDCIHITKAHQQHQHTGDPITHLRQLKKEYQVAAAPSLLSYAGGMVGFMSYDAVRLFEDIQDRHEDHDALPDIYFQIFKDSICFDHQQRKIILATLIDTPDEINQTAYRNIMQYLDTQYHMLLNAPIQSTPKRGASKNLPLCVEHIDDQTYIAMVEKAKQHIIAGDAFQVVLSRNFNIQSSIDPFALYRSLRLHSPSPYLFYLQYNDTVITGASPEKLVSLNDTTLESCPLAGTRPRGEGALDQQFEQELKDDDKENAEHIMLVDLARNDLGTIAQAGSVNVSKLKAIERTSHVMHLSSTVTATINPRFDALDALAKSLPAGTLSGAPKIRAMNIIDELEHSRRGIYGGTIAAIDANDNLISAIAIRTAMIKSGIITVRAGAGIVYDSDPKQEAKETHDKAQTVVSAINLAQGDLK